MIDVAHDVDQLKFGISLDDFTLPPLPKTVDRRGYIYLLKDSVYPDYIKMGRTSDLRKRLKAYNAMKPLATAQFTHIAGPFLDANVVERIILDQVYKEAAPHFSRLEWFSADHEILVKKWLLRAHNEATRCSL